MPIAAFLLPIFVLSKNSMDKERADLQFLGFCSIFKESFKIIFSWRKIFFPLTLTLIIPLSFVYLAPAVVSLLLFSKTKNDSDTVYRTPGGSTKSSKLSDSISSEMAFNLLFQLLYAIFLLILTLLSTSAVVYTIACIYTAKNITFKKVMSAVPKIWKRLMVTFLWIFLLLFIYHVVAVIMFVLWAVIFHRIPVAQLVTGIVLLILYVCGLVYIGIVWNLASVVSVLEEVYGIKALKKSKNLIKGKMGISVLIFIVLGVCLVGIVTVFGYVVVSGVSPNLAIRIVVGIVCFILLVKVILLWPVVQTIIYFIFKSYHHENVDKSSLADHLEAYALSRPRISN